MKGMIKDFSMSFDGHQRITIELDEDFRHEYDELKDKDIDVTIKKFRRKRSLNANAYAWTLIDRIAQKTGIPKTEVYRQAIREIGGVSDIVCVQNKAVAQLVSTWSQNGIGWITDTLPSKIPNCTLVVLYHGSSTYNTEQFSALIENLIQDAKTVGVETISQEELESLLRGESYGRKEI